MLLVMFAYLLKVPPYVVNKRMVEAGYVGDSGDSGQID